MSEAPAHPAVKARKRNQKQPQICTDLADLEKLELLSNYQPLELLSNYQPLFFATVFSFWFDP